MVYELDWKRNGKLTWLTKASKKNVNEFNRLFMLFALSDIYVSKMFWNILDKKVYVTVEDVFIYFEILKLISFFNI